MSKILYNVTVSLDQEILEDWLRWMQEVHIPDVMATGMFLNSRMCRVLNAQDPNEHTYAIQYVCQDMATFHKYQVQHAPRLQQDHTARYKDRFVAFRTLMEILPE